MSLVARAVRRPVTTVAATLAVLLLGAVSLTQLPVTLLPDVTLPVLTIRTSYPGAAAAEVSRFVAEPVEEAIASTPGLVELRSISRNGEATTTARFAWGTPMSRTVLTVRERLDNARERLPERAARPTLLTSDPGERPIAVLALSGPGDLRSLGRTARDVHSRRLEQVDGVASVAVVGAPEDEIRVELDPARLRALGLTTDDVRAAIEAANVSAAGGTVRRGQFRFSVRALTEFRTSDDVGDTPIVRAGTALRLRDVATVTVTTEAPKTLTALDGRAAIGLVVYKDAGSNTVAVTQRLTETASQLEQEFPGVVMTPVATQARFVVEALGNLGQEIVVGGVLSLFVILLFLRDWRGSLAIGLMIPLSVLVALVLLRLLDVTVNVLSLGGLALGVGLLVDNAIVVAEATTRKREAGLDPIPAAIAATEEVAGPLVAGTLTTVLVFGPIVFVKGLAAALFRDLSLSVVTSVGASLVLALTLMPVLLAAGTGPAAPQPRHAAPDRLLRWGDWWMHRYEAGVRWSLRHPRRVFMVAVGVTAMTVACVLRLPREILPQVDEGMIVAALALPEGTAIEETARQAQRVSDAAAALGAAHVYSRVGVATDEEVLAGADPGTSAVAQLLIPVPGGTAAGVFADALRRAVPDLADGHLALDVAGQSEFGSLIGREGRLVRVELTTRTLDEALALADTVRGRLRRVSTVADVRDAQASSQPVIEVTLDRTRLAERGIGIGTVQRALQGALGGVPASELRETDRRIPITVRFAGAAGEDLEAALAMPVAGVPLGQLVRWHATRAPLEVVRMDRRPVTVVEALVADGGTARATRDVEQAVSALALPPGATLRVAGAETERQRTTDQLTLVALLSVAFVFLVLAGEFASFTIPVVVMLTVPLAAAGGFLFLWATGQSLNAVSLIGIVVMIGMADNEAVVKLDAIRRLREAGVPLEEAVLEGGRLRLRAIAMTSITTITGVLPLVLGLGSGGALYQPLAAGVIGGSLSSLAVTFFLLPTAYVALERRRGA